MRLNPALIRGTRMDMALVALLLGLSGTLFAYL